MESSSTSDPLSIGSGWWTALSNTIFNGINAYQQGKWNKQQQKNWETQFEYTKWLNQQQMQREDTAVQRRAADLQAVGFNPLLANGQEAQTGTLTSFTGNAGGRAPQIDEIKNPIEAYLEAKQMNAQTQLTEEQAKLVKEQANQAKSSQSLNNAIESYYKGMTSNNDIVKGINLIKMLRDYHDYTIEMNLGIKQNESATPQNAYSAATILIKFLAKTMGINLTDGDINNAVEQSKQLGKTEYKIDENGYDLSDWGEAIKSIPWDKLEKEGNTTKGILHLLKMGLFGPSEYK